MGCCIFKLHIFIVHVILEKLLPAFRIIYNSYKSYNDWKFNFVWVTAMPINIPGTYTPRALLLMRLKYDWHVVLMFNFPHVRMFRIGISPKYIALFILPYLISLGCCWISSLANTTIIWVNFLGHKIKINKFIGLFSILNCIIRYYIDVKFTLN